MTNYFNPIFVEGRWPLFYIYLGVILAIILITIYLVIKEVKKRKK